MEPMRVGKLVTVLSDELLEYLREDAVFVEELEGAPGFARCVDYPDVPNHVYYEGYFHGLRDPAPFWSVNPRCRHHHHHCRHQFCTTTHLPFPSKD